MTKAAETAVGRPVRHLWAEDAAAHRGGGVCLPPFIYPFISDLNADGLAIRPWPGDGHLAPSALATVADLTKRRGPRWHLYTACTQSGSLLGPFLGGWLAHAAGFSTAFVTARIFGLPF